MLEVQTQMDSTQTRGTDTLPKVQESLLEQETVEVTLSNGGTALVDAADYPLVIAYKWRAFNTKSTSYAGYVLYRPQRVIFMHRLILSAPKSMDVDHRNSNGLDNRRCNIRLCTVSENIRNSRKLQNATSRFKGVYFDKATGKYKATITVKDRVKQIFLGRFNSEDDAARAYDESARKYFGEFARLNFS